jgi:hypothetical protein
MLLWAGDRFSKISRTSGGPIAANTAEPKSALLAAQEQIMSIQSVKQLNATVLAKGSPLEVRSVAVLITICSRCQIVRHGGL